MQQTDYNQEYRAADFEPAIALFSAGRIREAEEFCRGVLSAEPRHAHALHMLGIIRAEEGAVEEGLELLEQALATGVEHPAIHYAHGNLLLRLGRSLQAVDAFRRSLGLDPEQAHVQRFLGIALTKTGNFIEAESSLQAALARYPDDAPLLDALAMVYMAESRYTQARDLLERAVRLAPNFGDAYGNLAVVYEQGNRLGEATRITEEGLSRWPVDSALQMIQARLARRAGKFAQAQTVLQNLRRGSMLPALDRDSEFELGWCADGLGDVDQAFQHFISANMKARAMAARVPELEQVYPRQLGALLRCYAGDQSKVMHASAVTRAARTPAFLLGFPRSGTTLLDTMLGGHADLTVLEEQSTIQAMLDAYVAAGCDYPADVDSLIPELITELREVYYRAGMHAGWDGSKQLIDKSPFATVHLCLIQRVFPSASILFMARHPCDVVLSCFMHNFAFNSGTVHLGTLASSVRLYCDVMRLWHAYLRVLPLRYLTVRYEDLIEAPRAELGRILEFLEVGWSDAVLNHVEQALKRGHIPTPSYQQVSRPLYHDARDRWRRYSKYLQPYMQDLAPFIQAFGYAA